MQKQHIRNPACISHLQTLLAQLNVVVVEIIGRHRVVIRKFQLPASLLNHRTERTKYVAGGQSLRHHKRLRIPAANSINISKMRNSGSANNDNIVLSSSSELRLKHVKQRSGQAFR